MSLAALSILLISAFARCSPPLSPVALENVPEKSDFEISSNYRFTVFKSILLVLPSIASTFFAAGAAASLSNSWDGDTCTNFDYSFVRRCSRWLAYRNLFDCNCDRFSLDNPSANLFRRKSAGLSPEEVIPESPPSAPRENTRLNAVSVSMMLACAVIR